MTKKSDRPLDEITQLQVIALSLGVPELRIGLDHILSIAIIHSSSDRDWEDLPDLGYSEYEISCIKAAHAWITRVTGLGAFDVEQLIKKRDRK